MINLIDWKENAETKFEGREQETRPILVLEYASGGELFSLLAKQPLKPLYCRAIFKQLISCLEYLHSEGFSHRDIKPENILFDSDYNLKITDFGLSTGKVSPLKSLVGTNGYQAPEINFRKYHGS